MGEKETDDAVRKMYRKDLFDTVRHDVMVMAETSFSFSLDLADAGVDTGRLWITSHRTRSEHGVDEDSTSYLTELERRGYILAFGQETVRVLHGHQSFQNFQHVVMNHPTFSHPAWHSEKKDQVASSLAISRFLRHAVSRLYPVDGQIHLRFTHIQEAEHWGFGAAMLQW